MTVIINANRDGYSKDIDSINVGNLINILSQYDKNDKIILSFDNGYTYGSIFSDSFSVDDDYNDYDDDINETLRISGIQINEEYNEENIKINDIFVDSKGNEYKVTDIDNTYGEDKYGQPAVYVTFNNRMGMPSTSIKHIFHKKQ